MLSGLIRENVQKARTRDTHFNRKVVNSHQRCHLWNDGILEAREFSICNKHRCAHLAKKRVLAYSLPTNSEITRQNSNGQKKKQKQNPKIHKVYG